MTTTTREGLTKYAYHEPRGNPCDCGLTRARHRVRHVAGCACGCSHKGGRSPSDCGRTRKSRGYTIGVDGEGCGRDPHVYTLLAWSDTTGKRSGYIERLDGLGTLECLQFLCEIPACANPYGYYLGYDWTKILRDLPDESIYRLLRPALRAIPRSEGRGFTPVNWCGFDLHWLGGMMRIRPEKRKRWLTVWDVGKFFQTRFDNALKLAGIESGNIAEMKERRADFATSQSDEIRAYCLLECRQLAALVDSLNAAHEQAELPLTNWYGPGSAASVLLNRMGIADKRGETPAAMKRPIAQAFFGGRFEHSTIGRVEGPIFSADIVSAYPAQCLELPCLEHARWTRTTRERDLGGAEQACVEYETIHTAGRARAWGPLPVRMKDGTIVFPRSGGTGWTWLHEFREARRWSETRFLSAWILRRSCDCVPFAGIQHAFDTRLAVGKKSAVGGALKRAINSVYGKLAQSVGDPPFRSLVWAGMITSGCRAELLKLLWRYDDAILAVATDGLYATEPIDVPVGESLGSWECERADAITLVRPGIYWTGDSVRSRGIPRTSVVVEQAAIAAALACGAPGIVLPPITQFGAASSAIYPTPAGYVRSRLYGEWTDRPARLSFSPAPKRDDSWRPWVLDGIESAPYTGVLSAEAIRVRLAQRLGEALF